MCARPTTLSKRVRRHFERPVENLENRCLFAVTYNVINLAPNATNPIAYGSSNNGHVALASSTGASVYFNGTLTSLNIKGAAYDVNDAGQVVGVDSSDSSKPVAFIWQNGVEKKLGTLGGTSSSALAINTKGDVVGYAFTASGAEHAFLYTASTGKMSDLGTLTGGTYSLAEGINDSGQIIGNSGVANGSQHGFFYSAGKMNDLGLLPGGSSGSAYHGINNAALIAGDSATSGFSAYHVYTSQSGGALKDLGTAPSATDIFALDINSSGAIVGRDVVPNLSTVGGGFILKGGTYTQLTSQIDSSLGYVVGQAYSINDSGAIAGSGTKGGKAVALLLTPVVTPPEQTANVGGIVYNDANGDGSQDNGETGIQGVTVTLTDNGLRPASVSALVADPTTTTDATGHYLFSKIAANIGYDITIAAAGYKQINPTGKLSVLPFNGDNITTENFGVQKVVVADTASISGQVFNDVDGDGTKDATEGGLPGVTITLAPVAQGKLAAAASTTTTTDALGNYSFKSLAAGAYKVTAAQPSGYSQTLPATDGYTITLTAGQVVGGESFGEFKPGAAVTGGVSGVVFNDANGNGQKDPGEGVLSGVTIRLDPALQPNLVAAAVAGEKTTTTDGSGAFNFANITPGSYTLTEDLLSGYKQTVPASGGISVAIVAGKTVLGQTFAQFKKVVVPGTGTVTGTLWNDTDGDGFFNNGEVASGIRQVFIDTNGDGKLDNGERSTMSDKTGKYTFANVAAGSVKVSRVFPAGFHLSNASAGTGGHDVIATVISGGTATANLGTHENGVVPPPKFGTIVGTLWNDSDGDGQFDNGEEVGTGIRVVFLDANHNGKVDNGERSTKSDDHGHYAFQNVAVGTVAVSREFPKGFHLSNPAAGTNGKDILVDVLSGQTVVGNLGTHENAVPV